jgi:2-polyprenyl-3-methyl-5-hydroxy-6-metoxy-1,4-benzoquinol methylase
MESHIKDHYNSANLTQKIKTALLKVGKNLSELEVKDLSPIDQLHTGGVVSSIKLLKKADLLPNAKVLDAGCGIGGSSRLLAEQFNCRVTGLDLADKFIEAARFLTQCTKQENNINFQQGSVLDLPFEDNTFDAILCQHILMNIENKSKAFKEFFRVLKPNGKLILHEITKGENDTILFPVPWADKSSISFLEPWDVMKKMIKKTGFEKFYYSDETNAAGELWNKIKNRSKKPSTTPNPLNHGLIFGNNAKYFGKNMQSNFKNNCICLVEAILRKS